MNSDNFGRMTYSKFVTPPRTPYVDPIAEAIYQKDLDEDLTEPLNAHDDAELLAHISREALYDTHKELIKRAETQINLGYVTGSKTGNKSNIYQIAEELVKALKGASHA